MPKTTVISKKRWGKPAPSHIGAALAAARALCDFARASAPRGTARRAAIGMLGGPNSPATEGEGRALGHACP
eukprot:4504706-Pyramimonas_sp.AAC.1